MLDWVRLLWLVLVNMAIFTAIIVGGATFLLIELLVARHAGLLGALLWLVFGIGCLVGSLQWVDERKYGR